MSWKSVMAPLAMGETAISPVIALGTVEMPLFAG
jgi:hypothetical protein